jgi:hypothetical protein
VLALATALDSVGLLATLFTARFSEPFSHADMAAERWRGDARRTRDTCKRDAHAARPREGGALFQTAPVQLFAGLRSPDDARHERS